MPLPYPQSAQGCRDWGALRSMLPLLSGARDAGGLMSGLLRDRMGSAGGKEHPGDARPCEELKAVRIPEFWERLWSR
jgi:hypothetical protein